MKEVNSSNFPLNLQFSKFLSVLIHSYKNYCLSCFVVLITYKIKLLNHLHPLAILRITQDFMRIRFCVVGTVKKLLVNLNDSVDSRGGFREIGKWISIKLNNLKVNTFRYENISVAWLMKMYKK